MLARVENAVPTCGRQLLVLLNFSLLSLVADQLQNQMESLPSVKIDSVESNTTNVNHDNLSSSWNNQVGIVFFTIFLFIAAGIAEIGGGYMVWKGLRENYRPYLLVPLGSITLVLYGIIPTFQIQDNFGRVFAVYGGFFIVMSYLWGYVFDGMAVDTGDIVGSAIALSGVLVCWFWPR